MATALTLSALLLIFAGSALADTDNRLVFGSFSERANAERWSNEVTARLSVATAVTEMTDARGVWFRVVSEPLAPSRLLAVSQAAQAAGFDFWRLLAPQQSLAAAPAEVEPVPREPAAPVEPAAPAAISSVARTSPARPPAPPAQRPIVTSRAASSTDFDIALQSRTFAERGFVDQSRFQPSISARLDFGTQFADRWSFRAAPFVRYDTEDSRRTHADLREFLASYVDDSWELHAGVRRVFWGVTEFHHLVDVINQTDLVENIDGEDKLGQPMLNLSLVRDWGILDFYLLTGFRERTFAGRDGRLRYLLPVRTQDTRYESNDEAWRIDGAVRWVHNLGPVEFGVYHFSGTSRDPTLQVAQRPDRSYVFAPYYPVIEQTAIDAQAIAGDWVFKLEALTRSGEGNRYAAATGGFERTLVGVMGTRADLGLVLEYMWDERGDDADSLFEHDIALGTRFRFNDVADTQALFGLIWDHETHEHILKLEGSRRIGNEWALIIEGRAFGGAAQPDPTDIAAVLAALADPDRKTAAVARDDYLQLELTRYF